MGITRAVKVWVILVISASVWGPSAFAGRVADIASTKHNFSAAPGYSNTLPTGQQREMRAQSEVQICVFCHTPHAATTPGAPLWNRQLSQAQYTVYGSNIQGASTSSFQAEITQPNGTSKLCLSCHDGTMAVGAVNVLNGSANNNNIQMTTPDNKIPAGLGATTGFTRYLGTNLTNDHPISIVYDQNLVAVDGEMRSPQDSHIFIRGVDSGHPDTEQIQLEFPGDLTNSGGLVQCNSCHDPHIRSTDPTENIKFLRLNRLQVNNGPSTVSVFSPQSDIICLACHEKVGWAGSSHARSDVADEVYTNEAADVREFPQGTQVWESACLACHDTHTVEGSRRLLREGVDGTVINLSGNFKIKAGGNSRPAIEEACFACHSRDGYTLVGQDRPLNNYNFEVPDTKTDFNMFRHMPITTTDQSLQPGGKNYEVHDIGSPNATAGTDGLGKDLVESKELMGIGNRHAECTDCHNPHRVAKLRLFYQDPVTTQPAPAATHRHENGVTHNNLASGALRGAWGVEPVYGGTQFMSPPTDFRVKRGNPATTPIQPNSDPDAVTYLTREYQICFKCHSNYAFETTPPSTGWNPSLTPSNVNNIGPNYTNIAREYQSPASHQGEHGATGGGTNWVVNNHRSWHPVMRQTLRTACAAPPCGPGTRNANLNLWLPPFRAVGNQTMYCSDCHGNAIDSQGSAVPLGGENGYPWGPHGSNNYFLLKGPWSGNGPRLEDGTGRPGTGPGATNHLCFKCHQYNQYATQDGGGNILASGFGMTGMGCMGTGGGMCMMQGGGMGGMAFNNLHVFHNNTVTNFRCNLCHVAIPHGWKNKVFLANLNDVGPEGTRFTQFGEVRTPSRGGTGGYFDSPYYNRAALKVVQFLPSGQWSPNNCGSSGTNPDFGGNGQVGVPWMNASTEACSNLP